MFFSDGRVLAPFRMAWSLLKIAGGPF